MSYDSRTLSVTDPNRDRTGTPRPYGLPMFPISIYDLQDLIDEKGLLGKMLPD